MLGALVSHLRFVSGKRGWALPTIFALLALVFFASELVETRFDASRPQPNYVQYKFDADTGQAAWLSAAAQPDGWTQQFFTGGYTRGTSAFAPVYYFNQEFEVIQAPAPTLDLPAPHLEVLGDTIQGELRTLRLRLLSLRGAPYAQLQMALPGEFVAASVDGKMLDLAQVTAEQRRRFVLMFYNLPQDGVEIMLSVRSAEAIRAILTDYSNDLPNIPGMQIQPRPPEFMPAPYDFRDPTVVRKSYGLGVAK
jgi:hypothetical protein